MKRVTLLLFICFSIQVSAQKLFLHDILNANYKSYNTGSKIQVVIKGNTAVLNGKIVELTKDSIYFDNYPTGVSVNQIVAVLYKKNGVVKTILLNGAAGVLTFVGGLYALGGLIILETEPTVGAVALVFGGGLFTSGMLIFSHLKKNKNKLQEKPIDQVQFRLFIE